MAKTSGSRHVVLRNRRARHNFEILEELEAGIVLRGAEIKSLRAGKANFTDAFARVDGAELWLHNLHISSYESATHDAPDPLRARKLLAHRREIARLAAKTNERGLTLVPLDVHFTRGRAKVTIGLARGKKAHDKRHALRERERQRDVERALRGRE